jgi:glutaconate CoA-transferase subunit A
VRFKKAVQECAISVEDYSNYQMTLRFLAGAMGVPFLPTRSSLGTDIVAKWGFSTGMRESDPRLPDKKLVVAENPFGSWGNAQRIVFVPAINCDITIIHAQKADKEGTVRMEGLTFSDVEQAKSAKHVVVTCEELVEPESLKENPDLNQIPSFCVDAVIHIPHGAYPTACYRYYDYDPKYLNEYRRYAEDDVLYKTYLDDFIYGLKNHQELLGKVGAERLEKIKADKRTGYAVGLDRR